MRLQRLALLVLLASARLDAQSSPEEQARRLLEDGRAYRAQGKYKQALDDFNTIVTGFPSSASAPEALLEIGRYLIDVEGNVEKGRAALEDVAQRFPQSEAAPGAYYCLGKLTLDRASTPAELEDALAQFNRVQRLYARSEWLPRALYASGLAHRKAGRFADAVDAQRRVALEYPSSDAAPAAQFEIGHCLGLMGEYRPAMEEYQRVRNRYPESEWAARALERNTLLYRLYGQEKPAFALDPSYSAGTGDVLKDVRAILLTPDLTLWVASDKTKSAVSLDRSGKLGPSFAAEDIRTLSLSPRGEIVVASRLAVRVGKEPKAFAMPPDRSGATAEALDHIEAAAVTPGGSILVSDEKRHRVYRYDAQYEFKGTFPDAKERHVSRIVVDGEGGISMLGRDERVVEAFDEAGKLLRTLKLKGAAFEVKRPVDIALDPLRDLYVVDEEGGLFIFSPQGQLLTTLGGEELRHPKAVTLDPSGAILVYDDKTQRIVRFK